MRNEAQVAMHNIIAFSMQTVFHCPFFWFGDHLLMDSTLSASKVLPDHHERGCYTFIAKPTSPRIHSQQCADYIRQDGLIHFHMPLRC
jgi:hypothetical protein